MNRNLMSKVLALSLFAVMVICGFGAMLSDEIAFQKDINKEDCWTLFWAAIGAGAAEYSRWMGWLPPVKGEPSDKISAIITSLIYVLLGSIVGCGIIKTLEGILSLLFRSIISIIGVHTNPPPPVVSPLFTMLVGALWLVIFITIIDRIVIKKLDEIYKEINRGT